MTRKKLPTLLHILFWTVFFYLYNNLQGKAKFYFKKISASNAGGEIIETLSEPSFIYIIIGDTLLKVIMVYICLLYILPKFLSIKNHGRFIFSLILVFCVTLLLTYGVESFVSERFFIHQYFKESSRFLVTSGVFHFGLLSLALGYGFSMNWYTVQRQKEILQKESLASELKMLKSQINPHFLFNTLNNIFAIARKYEDPRLSESLAQLSHLMRYMLNENTLDLVPLAKEVEYIHDFIALQRLRFTEELSESVSFEVLGDYEQLNIAPLLLIPFIENAFKFSPSVTDPFNIDIELKIINELLTLRVYNTINKKLQQDSNPNGLGLMNVKRRLDLLYPDKFTLLIKDADDTFLVELKVELTV